MARDEQAAIDVIMKIVRYMVTKNGAVNDSESIEIVAAALAAQRREALTEAAQVARDTKWTPPLVPTDFTYNEASDDIAAALEALRDAAAVEAARDILWKLESRPDEKGFRKDDALKEWWLSFPDSIEKVDIISSALSQARREAWNEACEKCAGECVDYNDSESCRKLKQ